LTQTSGIGDRASWRYSPGGCGLKLTLLERAQNGGLTLCSSWNKKKTHCVCCFWKKVMITHTHHLVSLDLKASYSPNNYLWMHNFYLY